MFSFLVCTVIVVFILYTRWHVLYYLSRITVNHNQSYHYDIFFSYRMTEIPFRKTFLLTDTNIDEWNDHKYEPESIIAVWLVMEKVHEWKLSFISEFLQNILNSTPAIAGGVGSTIANLGDVRTWTLGNLGAGGMVTWEVGGQYPKKWLQIPKKKINRC